MTTDTTNCHECNAEIHRLAVFPAGRCIDCHARNEEGRDPLKQWEEMRAAFGLKP